MANELNLSQLGTLPPELYAQQQQLNRQQQMAQMLMQQGQQAPQGQMISGRYVKPSWAQQLQAPVGMLLGAYMAKQGDESGQKTAQALRDYYADELKTFTQKQKENPQEAYLYGATAYNPAIASASMKKITEGPNWAEVSQFNPKTGNTDTYVYDKNSGDPQSTMRFVATSKPALTPNEILHLNDQGIGTGGYGGSMPNRGGPVGGMPTVGGNAPVNPPVVGGNAPTMAGGNVRPVGNAPMPTIKPVSSTNAPEDTLVKTYGYDPFKAPPMPVMPSGSAARAWKADIYKPLDGTPANVVTGATTYVDALDKYSNYINGLSPKDLANPQVRTKLNSLYAQVKLTGKEANNLGVLNGGDERILEAVVPNYSDIMVTKGTVKKILDEQKEFGSGKIVSTYRTAQKPVPENMRKYIYVPKVEEETTGAPKQTGATARAVLNNQPIEVRGGKWVYSSSGEEVK
jgi:hypothetical protein